MQQTVNVQAEPSSITTQVIDLASAVHQGVVTSNDLETLPLAARSFANIAYLVPGTEPVEPSDPTKARITAVSTGGSSGLNNELSVDGGDNSDDWIGGFLQNFSPDAIQEFAFQTAQEDADTGSTTAGSVVITTKRGTNEWHGTGAFYERAAALNARFPIENPAPNPKQPFSRQNYVGTLGGPIKRDKLWMFSSIEYVHEDASIAYSPASTTQFNALAQLAADGLIPGVSSITVPQNVPIPFRDYIGDVRFDWSQSPKSQWFLRTSEDNYLTHNALVQQATLPSTGLTTHNNYWNAVISNTYTFNPRWLGAFVFDVSELHLTQARNSTLGYALAFPFSSTSQTISGFETFGDNQFATPITLFPDLRNQEKYQLRYDVSHATGDHAFKFGVNFIHEPVLSGAFPGQCRNLVFVPAGSNLLRKSAALGISQRPGRGRFHHPRPRRQLLAERAAPRALRGRFLASHSTSHRELRPALPDDVWPVRSLGPQSGRQSCICNTSSAADSGERSARRSRPIRPAPRRRIFSRRKRQNSDPRRFWDVLQRPRAKRMGHCVSGRELDQRRHRTVQLRRRQSPIHYRPRVVSRAMLRVEQAILIDGHYRTPYAIHTTGGVQHAFNQHWTLAADYTHEQGNHGYRAYSFTGGTNLFTPLIPVSDPNYSSDQASVVPDLNLFKSDNRSSYNSLMLHLQGNVSRRFSLTANYTLSKAKTWGCLLGELFDYVNGVCNPLNPFGPGDYGPSGEDVTHRFVLAGTLHVPGGFELTTITQAESARPFTITNATSTGRISVNGVPESLDEVRGTPYIQADLRVTRPFKIGERWQILPFAEFFNLFNRNNPGANYVTNIALLPVPSAQAQLGNITDICTNATCTATQPITSINQLRVPGGALGDFFGPGTTVGIPFAAQLGVRVVF